MGAQRLRRPLGPVPGGVPRYPSLSAFSSLAAKLEKGPPLGRAFCVCQTKHEGRVSKEAGPVSAQRPGADPGLGKYSSVVLN